MRVFLEGKCYVRPDEIKKIEDTWMPGYCLCLCVDGRNRVWLFIKLDEVAPMIEW